MALIAADPPVEQGSLPRDERGRVLNLDFERGDLSDWTATGDAFRGQPVSGDKVAARRSDMKSRHTGKFWVGTFEVLGDQGTGTLTSAPFVLDKPFATFLIAGGSTPSSRVDLIDAKDESVLATATGDVTEDMKPVLMDLSKYQGRTIRIRLVDSGTGGWEHLNFDDFRLHAEKPAGEFRPQALTPDVYANAGLDPENAAKAMTVPDGFHVNLFAGEPDVVQPIAFTLDDRGRVWVAEAYSYTHRLPDDQARDRILIFEDTDGDGKFDKRKVFTDKLNLVSGLEVGFGGVWVGAAPYLMFIPDADGDDAPDGPPQILLDGWAMHDTHETLNTFIWGPDGWLYGCHGVFTHSNVGKPGTPDKERTPINAGIWRYHPTRHQFEVFAHGTSNPWGVDFDANGQAFLTSCVIPHLYYVIPGARYERQAGQHFNPYTYDDIKTIADHRHYLGANPHGGNGKSDSAGGGHAHAGAMIYQGAAWPKEYDGSIFMNNIHGARMNRDVLTPSGSGFIGSHAPDFLLANDSWSQLLNFRYGPDGNVYMIDWYDKNQCHRVELDLHDRSNGRIFKLVYGTPKFQPVDLKRESSLDLVKRLANPNAWYARQARRILQERGLKPDVTKALESIAADTTKTAPMRLRAFWVLQSAEALGESLIESLLKDEAPYVRSWAVRAAADGRKPTGAELKEFAGMAKSDPSPVVRLQLASTLQRLPNDQRWAILEGLVAHSEDAGDANLPLMDWYAAEPLAAVDPARAVALARSSRIPQFQSFMTRRIASLGTDESIALLVAELAQSKSSDTRGLILDAIGEALKGRREVKMPAEWPAAFRVLSTDTSAEVRTAAISLGVNFGDPAALDAMRTTLADSAKPIPTRKTALAALLKARDPKLTDRLYALIEVPELRADAIRGLALYESAKTPGVLLAAYPKLDPAQKRDALSTLCSRPSFGLALLEAVAAKKVASTDLSADLIRQLRSLRDPSLDKRIEIVWGMARETSADKAAQIAKFKAVLASKPKVAPDVSLGRAVFAKPCAQCHTLFATGGTVGPELTGSNRRDLDYVLSNVLDPSSLIGKDYQAQTIATSDGRILTGIVRAEDKDSVTLVTANETIIVPAADIEERRVSDESMMPADLWTKLSENEIRSLVAYLASPAQTPMLATTENVGAFFNGVDLAGWQGEASLWKVENGEIVGKTDGLSQNKFLRSDLSATDFRLVLEVKLVDDAGNSGVQFRSEPLPDGEMKGYQADIGPGWWGKLYEESGRGLLWPESGEKFIKKGEWNTYEITARGAHIETKLNGNVSVSLDDPSGRRSGIFALQLHSGGATEVRFRNLKLEILPPTDQ
jgi:putative membrane-bound dehydrogenase-like protein